jgi:hypothetical protein
MARERGRKGTRYCYVYLKKKRKQHKKTIGNRRHRDEHSDTAVLTLSFLLYSRTPLVTTLLDKLLHSRGLSYRLFFAALSTYTLFILTRLRISFLFL